MFSSKNKDKSKESSSSSLPPPSMSSTSSPFPLNTIQQDLPNYKIIVVGDTNVGKTSIVDRFIDNKLAERYASTIGCDYKRRTVLVGEDLVSLSLWDTAGQERFRSLVQHYYHGAHGIVFVYDITNPRTFENISAWWKEVNELVNTDSSVRILLGNKSDMMDQRKVLYEQGKILADERQMDFVEVSAVDSTNVNDAFLLLVQQIHHQLGMKTKKDVVMLSNNSRKQDRKDGSEDDSSSGCCDCGFYHKKKPSNTAMNPKTGIKKSSSNPDIVNPLMDTPTETPIGTTSESNSNK